MYVNYIRIRYLRERRLKKTCTLYMLQFLVVASIAYSSHVCIRKGTSFCVHLLRFNEGNYIVQVSVCYTHTKSVRLPFVYDTSITYTLHVCMVSFCFDVLLAVCDQPYIGKVIARTYSIAYLTHRLQDVYLKYIVNSIFPLIRGASTLGKPTPRITLIQCTRIHV